MSASIAPRNTVHDGRESGGECQSPVEITADDSSADGADSADDGGVDVDGVDGADGAEWVIIRVSLDRGPNSRQGRIGAGGLLVTGGDDVGENLVGVVQVVQQGGDGLVA